MGYICGSKNKLNSICTKLWTEMKDNYKLQLLACNYNQAVCFKYYNLRLSGASKDFEKTYMCYK
jgi:hypothetical protein